MDRTANLLGAVAIAMTDRIRQNLDATAKRSGEAAAALVVLGYAPGLSVEPLRQVLGLSHPGTVRLVDRLADDGLVERRRAQDARAVSLHLTKKGTGLRKRLLKQRGGELEVALDGLSKEERASLGVLLSKVLKNLPKSEMDKHNICRLCEVGACEQCPIPGNAV
ncbi:MAG: MarR family transcriptional regulator [Pseudomonadota bacterium]